MIIVNHSEAFSSICIRKTIPELQKRKRVYSLRRNEADDILPDLSVPLFGLNRFGLRPGRLKTAFNGNALRQDICGGSAIERNIALFNDLVFQ